MPKNAFKILVCKVAVNILAQASLKIAHRCKYDKFERLCLIYLYHLWPDSKMPPNVIHVDIDWVLNCGMELYIEVKMNMAAHGRQHF